MLTTAGETLDGSDMAPADRGRRPHHDHKDDRDHDCVAMDRVLIGPVCVTVRDVISNILTM